MLIVVMYLGVKDPTLALLITIAYMMSIVQTNMYGSYDTVKIKDYQPETLLLSIKKKSNLKDNLDGFNNSNNEQIKMTSNVIINVILI